MGRTLLLHVRLLSLFPPEIRLKGNEEIVYNGFLVRLWPRERVKCTALNLTERFTFPSQLWENMA